MYASAHACRGRTVCCVTVKTDTGFPPFYLNALQCAHAYTHTHTHTHENHTHTRHAREKERDLPTTGFSSTPSSDSISTISSTSLSSDKSSRGVDCDGDDMSGLCKYRTSGVITHCCLLTAPSSSVLTATYLSEMLLKSFVSNGCASRSIQILYRLAGASDGKMSFGKRLRTVNSDTLISPL